MCDGTGLAEALLGLDGFRVLDVREVPDELVVTIETTAEFVGCERCGVRAEAHARMRVEIRDLACFGRPARLVWIKRRWRCRERACDAKTWTERSEHVDAQVVLTRRAVVHVAAGDGPLVVLFGEHGADEADDGGAVGEDPDDVGAAAELLVEPFLGVVRPDLPPVLFRERR